MKNDDVEFVEDKTFLSPLPDNKIPEKSIEGWIYKKIPGNIAVKRYILSCLILFIFILAGVFFLLARSNSVGL